MKDLKEIKKFRHTIKAYDDKKEISESVFKEIIEFARFAPNSFNFQTTRLISIDRNSELNNELKDEKYMMFNNSLVGKANKMIFFVVPNSNMELNSKNHFLREGVKYGAFQKNVKVSNVTEEMVDKALKPVLGAWKSMGFTDLGQWSTRQAYIYLGYLTMAAASQGIDTTSIEGFIPEKVTQLFRNRKMIAEDEQVVLTMAMGYRLNDESFNNSERKPLDNFLKEF